MLNVNYANVVYRLNNLAISTMEHMHGCASVKLMGDLMHLYWGGTP